MNITRCSIISRRRVERDNGERCFLGGCVCEKRTQSFKKREKKHHMPDVCRAYDAYEAYEVWKGLFLTPSTSCVLLPPPTGRSPSLEEGGLGVRRSRPSPLPSIAYRGFAVAPITLRAPSRSLLYNPGCRVETLLVSKGVMGFLGDLREDRSRARPVGGSARRSIPSEREQPCCDL